MELGSQSPLTAGIKTHPAQFFPVLNMCALCISVQGAVFRALDLVQNGALEQAPPSGYLWLFCRALHSVVWIHPNEDNILLCPELQFGGPVKKNYFCRSLNILLNSFLGAYSLKTPLGLFLFCLIKRLLCRKPPVLLLPGCFQCLVVLVGLPRHLHQTLMTMLLFQTV